MSHKFIVKMTPRIAGEDFTNPTYQQKKTIKKGTVLGHEFSREKCCDDAHNIRFSKWSDTPRASIDIGESDLDIDFCPWCGAKFVFEETPPKEVFPVKKERPLQEYYEWE